MIFGTTTYGLSAVAVVLALYCLAVVGGLKRHSALAALVGDAVAFVLPAHVAVAFLGMLGAGSASAIRILIPGSTRHVPSIPEV